MISKQDVFKAIGEYLEGLRNYNTDTKIVRRNAAILRDFYNTCVEHIREEDEY